jgi:hypothetical protein
MPRVQLRQRSQRWFRIGNGFRFGVRILSAFHSLDRLTGKLRWQPIYPARVIFVRYDCFSIRSDHLAVGIKGPEDALKVRTTGRRDHQYLHYFGAIVDDGGASVGVSWGQELVAHPKDSRVTVQVV